MIWSRPFMLTWLVNIYLIRRWNVRLGGLLRGEVCVSGGRGGVNMNPLLTQKNQTFLSFFHKMEESEKK